MDKKQKENEEKIIFLESNTKKSTIKSFLGSDYKLFATGGHLLSIEKTGEYNLGVDLKSFSPKYEVIDRKVNLVKFWKDYLNKKENFKIFIATDPDREGEGIAREIVDLLKLSEGEYKRLLFHEITSKAIKESLENPLQINSKLVDAQMSREVLDRMIGFCLSSILQKKMNAWSAGRVQSVVLKLIIDREREINDYNQNKKFLLCVDFNIKKKTFRLIERVEDSRNLKIYESLENAQQSVENLSESFNLIKQSKDEKYIFSKHPLTTSLLLYESKIAFGYSIQKTTSIAQQLYEGVFIKSKKRRVSLITYPRTDSTRISRLFISQVSTFIKEKWGEDFFKFSTFSPKDKKNVQDAHEAIRPTYFSITPESLESEDLEKEIFNVYGLIYNHTISSFIKPIKYLDNFYLFSNEGRNFGINEKIVIDQGFLVNKKSSSLHVYGLIKNSYFDQVSSFDVEKNSFVVQEDTDNAPRRYTEGTLIKKLEKLGIGRPSTYNSFSKIILKRKYSSFDRKGFFIPTDLGFKVNDWLQKEFSFLINENYTASLEEQLDKISDGEQNYFSFISNFWKDFCSVYKLVEKKEFTEKN